MSGRREYAQMRFGLKILILTKFLLTRFLLTKSAVFAAGDYWQKAAARQQGPGG